MKTLPRIEWAFSMLLSAAVGVGVGFGIAPAFRATRLELVSAFKSSGARRSEISFGKLLIVAQVALSMLLLVGAGVFARSLQNLAAVDVGFRTDHILLFKVDPTLRGYKDARFYAVLQRVLDRIAAIPAVRSVALSDMPLLGGGFASAGVRLEGAPPDDEAVALTNWVSADFFRTMDMPILLGRGFSPADAGDTPRVAVVNEMMVRQLFPGASPIGRKFLWSSDMRPIEVVGVVGDAKYQDVRAPIAPTFFVPLFEGAWQRGKTFAVRTTGDPTAVIDAVRRKVAEVDADLMVYGVKTQAAQAADTMAQERLIAAPSGFFGVLAPLLASVGLSGLLSYSVANRTREIGVRMALGARRSDVARMVMHDTIALVGTGLVIGLALSLAGMRAVEGMLYGLAPNDPLTLTMAMALMIASAAAAAALPARRAARVDPMAALRCE